METKTARKAVVFYRYDSQAGIGRPLGYTYTWALIDGHPRHVEQVETDTPPPPGLLPYDGWPDRPRRVRYDVTLTGPRGAWLLKDVAAKREARDKGRLTLRRDTYEARDR